MRADILAWSVPAVFAAFGLCFALLSHLHRSLRWWSGSFFVAALGFAMTVVPTAPGSVVKPTVEDSMFLFALSGANVAFAMRAARPPNFVALVLLTALGTFGAALSLFFLDSAPYEIFWVQSACALIMLLSAFEMRNGTGNLDPLLFWLCIAIAISLGLQNVLFMSEPPSDLTVSTWRETDWGFVFQLSGAASGLLLAIGVILATTLDIIERLHASAHNDALTGALNRRGLEQRVEAIRKGLKPGASLSLVVSDLDHFKSINDRFGHEAGDAVLCAFTALCETYVGAKGCFARLGGEEFAIVFAQLDASAAARSTERLRAATQAIEWPGRFLDLEVTASFGVVELRPGEALAQAIGRADELLYRAKARGRNMVVAEDGASSEPLSELPLAAGTDARQPASARGPLLPT
ncbi:GGDEF domain-containing protein [Aureimonas sp. ME7]|uniref:GGDEF domain-containing protein n=1 Tax=Aureimonas sp. ME7 TaxID=2744252 RepID=UPI0015F4205A|nr:GGDEF domain-containing protein [Aureimonas sp. ME7]